MFPLHMLLRQTSTGHPNVILKDGRGEENPDYPGGKLP